LRYMVMIHSYVYYVFCETIIDDYQWQTWADELVKLQGEGINIDFHDKEFKGFDGSTGHDLIGCEIMRQNAIDLMIDHGLNPDLDKREAV